VIEDVAQRIVASIVLLSSVNIFPLFRRMGDSGTSIVEDSGTTSTSDRLRVSPRGEESFMRSGAGGDFNVKVEVDANTSFFSGETDGDSLPFFRRPFIAFNIEGLRDIAFLGSTSSSIF
jgi:uncharacterized linocin/CFP29 family protein